MAIELRLYSMDWFKGKITGLSPIFNGKITLVSG
jgi:hypothetical protein